jgi:prepilin-type N-terminal cleavage/methylation domain-containing protein
MLLAKSSFSNDRGFSLIETLVATTIMSVALASLAQLFLISTKANQSARITTNASVLAQQKMEQLRGLTWGFDILGLPLSDTTSDLTVVPEQPQGGPGLTPSPDGSLRNNFDGFCDFLDGRGQSLGGGSVAPVNTVYVRRWSVEPLPTNPNNTLILQVMVTRWRARGVADIEDIGGGRRLPDEARVISVKTRKAS